MEKLWCFLIIIWIIGQLDQLTALSRLNNIIEAQIARHIKEDTKTRYLCIPFYVPFKVLNMFPCLDN